MSDTYVREANDGGDLDIWGPYEQDQNRLGIGQNTRMVYLDGANLKISAGRVGLNYSSSGYGVIRNSAARTISIAGLTVSLWAVVELSQTAGTVVTSITSIAGANNPAVLPTWTYDPVKGGHYQTATKRAPALVWINAAGAVEGIVNEIPGVDGYSGYSTSDDAYDIIYPHFRLNYSYSMLNDIDIEYVLPKSAAYTILDYKQYKGGEYSKYIRITATAGANGWRLILCSPTGNAGRIIKVNRLDSGAGCVTIVPNGGTISGASYIFLFEQYEYAELYCDGLNWYLLHANLSFQTGGINTNDETNREFGDAFIPVDTSSGTRVIGEKFTEATSGNTGILISDSGNGTASGNLIFKKVTGTGIFTDNRTLTGSISGATCAVNIPGSSSKNADSNFYIGFGNYTLPHKIEFYMYAGTTFQMGGAQRISDANMDGSSHMNYTILPVDANNIKIQTGTGGVEPMGDAGTIAVWTTSDYSYNVIDKINF